MQTSGPTLRNRGRKAAENALKIRPLPNHRGHKVRTKSAIPNPPPVSEAQLLPRKLPLQW